jgi:glycosyltransferase involved in cell wall biosynthesis
VTASAEGATRADGADPSGSDDARGAPGGPAGDADDGGSGAADRGDDDAPDLVDAAVLVIADHPNSGKIERHYGPLADVTRETTMVCVDGGDPVDGIRFVEVPDLGSRLVGVVALFFLAAVEAVRNDYDAFVSISLVPYGSYSLVLGTLLSTPAHLGIIGADIDKHARAWYGPLVRWAFRRFDSVSVPGTDHRRRLVEMGVPADRAAVLANAIDVSHYRPPPSPVAAEYDFVWVGRFEAEKDPLLFVESLAALRERGVEFDAVMLGAGSLEGDVREALDRRGLSEAVTLTGWVDDPRTYYRRSRLFVLTSARDALPLTLIEAMATGVPAVVPDVGSVLDVAEEGENAAVVPERTPAAFAAAMADLAADPDRRARLGANATAVRSAYSYGVARDDWRRILDTLGCASSSPPRPPGRD